jgi:hypothetical protein
MSEEKLLLIVQTNVAPEGEDDFNDWYNDHIPHLLKLRGYLWGQRYVGMRGDIKYIAVYQIESSDYFDYLLGPDNSKRHPITLSEWEKWDKLLLQDTRISVYQQISGTPFADPLLRSDRPIFMEMFDVATEKEQEWNQRYDSSHLPNLLKLPGCVMGGRFRIVENPSLAHLQTRPVYVAVYELESEDVVPSLMDREKMSSEAKAEFDSWKEYCQSAVSYESLYAYRIISKHWKFEELPYRF